MEKGAEKDPTPRWISLRLSERFKNVLYPVDLPMLLRLLPNIGYIVNKKILKGVLEPGESFATKGNVELILDQSNKTIGIEGREVTEVIDGFSELRGFWLEQLTPSPDAETHYLELVGQGIAKSANNPTRVFTAFWTQFDGIQRLTKVLGWNVANFGLRLVPENADPNNADWFDLRIQPSVISSANRYFIEIVWRNKDIETALNNFRKVNETVKAVIQEVEKG
jgi:hypothetical protein